TPKDLRGLNIPGNKKPAHTIQLIKNHIQSFPVKMGHYTGKEYCYLSEKLDVKRTHALFLEETSEVNHTVLRFCCALVELGRFDSVEQYFPIQGHSFLPCDRNFAVTKRKILAL
ncbi:hypothetical protein ILUMI_11063, partial [Ignelater luminosus]